jgi:hypothetical protein
MTAQEFAQNVPDYIQIALSVIGAASVIATLTPTPKDDVILYMAKRALDFLACNFGKAKNKQ